MTPSTPDPLERFDRTVTVLEAHWGPYHTWTRAQHQKHTAILRQLSDKRTTPADTPTR